MAELKLSTSVDNSKSVSGLQQFQQSVDTVAKKGVESFGSFGSSLLNVGGTIAVVLTAFNSLRQAISDGLAKFAGFKKTAAEIGDTEKSVEKLANGLKIFGVSVDSTEDGLNKLNLKMSEALSGNEEAQQSFKKLGISLQDLASNSPTEIMLKLADAIHNSSNQGKTMGEVLKVIGKGNNELLVGLRQGSSAIQEVSGRMLEFNNQSLAALSAVRKGWAWLWDNIVVLAVNGLGSVVTGIDQFATAFNIVVTTLAKSVTSLLITAYTYGQSILEGNITQANDLLKEGIQEQKDILTQAVKDSSDLWDQILSGKNSFKLSPDVPRLPASIDESDGDKNKQLETQQKINALLKEQRDIEMQTSEVGVSNAQKILDLQEKINVLKTNNLLSTSPENTAQNNLDIAKDNLEISKMLNEDKEKGIELDKAGLESKTGAASNDSEKLAGLKAQYSYLENLKDSQTDALKIQDTINQMTKVNGDIEKTKLDIKKKQYDIDLKAAELAQKQNSSVVGTLLKKVAAKDDNPALKTLNDFNINVPGRSFAPLPSTNIGNFVKGLNTTPVSALNQKEIGVSDPKNEFLKNIDDTGKNIYQTLQNIAQGNVGSGDGGFAIS